MWPNERQWVTMGTFALAILMLGMAFYDKSLWKEELFKTLITVVIVTGLINSVLSFHFSANKGDESRSANTGKAFDAIKATAEVNTTPTDASITLQPGETARAAGPTEGLKE